MPTTITSAGVTFTDTTTLTSATLVANSVGTTQITNGSVTAEKLGTTEQKQIAKAWVNFNGLELYGPSDAALTMSISCNSGSTTGTWTGGWASSYIGVIYKITQINGVTGATLGGVNVSTLGVQIISVVAGVSATFRFLSGTTTSAQSVTGTGSSASGFSYIATGIRSSFNVSSITKVGTGEYTVNFATAMADANYAAVITGEQLTLYGPISSTTAAYRLGAYTTAGVLIDRVVICVSIFGN
jgi:hypothetical protein